MSNYKYIGGQILETISGEDQLIIESMSVKIINEAYHVQNSKLTAIIQVFGDEGFIPHFHVKYGNKETCFCIYEPLYANHERWHVPMLEIERHGLNAFLISPDKNSLSGKTNYWTEICKEWENKNFDHYYEFKDIKNPIKPNYINIRGYKNMGFKNKKK